MTTTKITKNQLRQMIKEAIREQIERKTPEQKSDILKSHLGFALNKRGVQYVLYILEVLYEHGQVEARDLGPRPGMNVPGDLFERMQTAGIIEIGERPYLNYKITSKGKRLVSALGMA